MIDLAERLRTELPELASGLLGELHEVDDTPTLDPEPVPVEAALPRRQVLVGTAAAAITGLAVVGGARWLSSDRATTATTATSPTEFGSWLPIADAPIAPRQGALAAWNGETAVFWAGHSSEGDNTIARSTGAFYDPTTDSWERANTPVFAHPGLEGIAVGGEVYATAKGGLVRANLRDGSYTGVPTNPSMTLWSILEVGGRIWGIGPGLPAIVQSRPELLAFAEYFVDSNTWGPTTIQKAPIGPNIASLGNVFVSCADEGTCVVVDPVSATDAPGVSEDAFGFLAAPNADPNPTIAFAGSTVLAFTLASKDGRIREVYRADGDRWQLLTMIPTGPSSELTLAGAGQWLIALSSEQPPVALHVETGLWHQFDAWPMTGVRNPSTVWTGTELIIWGGEGSRAAEGAIWTAPQ